MKTGSRLKSNLQLRPGGDLVGSCGIKIPLFNGERGGDFCCVVDKNEVLTKLENFTTEMGFEEAMSEPTVEQPVIKTK